MSKIIPGDIIFKGLVGSHAHGTNIETSDKDYAGVYIQTPEHVLNYGYQPQVKVSKDEIYYELRRFIELCCSSNPTMLELLFLPSENVILEEPVFKKIRFLRYKFITKKCRNSFGGYAKQQIKKANGLDKKMNWGDRWKDPKTPLDFCYIVNPFLCKSVPFKNFLHVQSKFHAQQQKNYGLQKLDHMKDTYLYYYDENDAWTDKKGIVAEGSNEVRLHANIPKSLMPHGVLHFNSTAYSEYCRKHKEYKIWLKERNTQRYVDVENHGQQIDGKNMLHAVRLVEMGKEISEGKGFIVKRPNVPYLLSIRKGKVDLKTLLKKVEHDLQIMDKNFNKSKDLPEDIDKDVIYRYARAIRSSFYKLKLKDRESVV